MSLLTNLLIGRSGLGAAQAGVNATSHNVTNAATDGATRRRVATSVGDPIRDGRLWLGTGVVTDGIERVTSRTLTARRVAGIGVATQSQTAWESLASLEGVLDAGVGHTTKDALEAFYDSLTRVTADPADLSLRSGVVRAAQDLGTTVGRDARVFSATLEDRVADTKAALPLVNDTLSRIAELNDAIASSQGGTLVAGDLVDRRDVLLMELGEVIGAKAEIHANGTATVYIHGHAAVSDGHARSLSVSDAGDPPRILLSHSKDESIDVTDGLGGRVGGYMTVYEEVSDWIDRLDTFAEDFATSMNDQHRLGFDLNGDAGVDLFTFDAAGAAASLAVADDFIGDSSKLAFGGSSPTLAGDLANLRAILDLETAVTVDGRLTASSFLTELVSEIGADVKMLEQEAFMQDALQRDLEQLHQNLHGIDLDEEAANLMMYQAAYQASARVITTTNSLLGTLMELV